MSGSKTKNFALVFVVFKANARTFYSPRFFVLNAVNFQTFVLQPAVVQTVAVQFFVRGLRLLLQK